MTHLTAVFNMTEEIQNLPRLLIVDDDTELATMLVEFLELQGFQVNSVASGEAALDRITEEVPDLIILDVMLPGIDGFAVLRILRIETTIPVLMLTARGEEAERIHGLMEGADDYLPKPFNPLELTARVRNVLRRSEAVTSSPDDIETGSLRIDLKRRKFTINDEPVQLTAAELRVLEQLMRRPGEVLTRAQLTERALGREFQTYDRSIDTLISKLRGKFNQVGFPGDSIRSLRGHGYVLDIDSQAGEP